MMEPVKENSHKILIIDADGHRDIYEADQIKICVPTARCVKFWATFVACLIGIGVGMFFMIFQGAESAYFPIGNTILTLAIGVLIPGPEYESVIPKKISPGRSPENISQESSEPIHAGESKYPQISEREDA